MRKNIFQVVKASAAAIVFSLVFVLLFTLIIQLFSLPLDAVKPVNQVFKTLSIAAGGLIFLRGERGLVKGVIFGLAAVLLTYILYGLISGTLSISWRFPLEILLGVVAGGVSGIIAVNIKKT